MKYANNCVFLWYKKRRTTFVILPFDLMRFLSLRHFVHKASQFRFEISSFVHMDDVTFSQFVKHRANLRQGSSCCSFVSSLAQVAHSITCGFCIIMIVCFASCRLADTLQRAFMICHLCLLFLSPMHVNTILGQVLVISIGIERICLRT